MATTVTVTESVVAASPIGRSCSSVCWPYTITTTTCEGTPTCSDNVFTGIEQLRTAMVTGNLIKSKHFEDLYTNIGLIAVNRELTVAPAKPADIALGNPIKALHPGIVSNYLASTPVVTGNLPDFSFGSTITSFSLQNILNFATAAGTTCNCVGNCDVAEDSQYYCSCNY